MCGLGFLYFQRLLVCQLAKFEVPCHRQRAAEIRPCLPIYRIELRYLAVGNRSLTVPSHREQELSVVVDRPPAPGLNLDRLAEQIFCLTVTLLALVYLRHTAHGLGILRIDLQRSAIGSFCFCVSCSASIQIAESRIHHVQLWIRVQRQRASFLRVAYVLRCITDLVASDVCCTESRVCRCVIRVERQCLFVIADDFVDSRVRGCSKISLPRR